MSVGEVFKKILAVLLPLVVLGAGIGVYRTFVATAPTASKRPPVKSAPLVRVEAATTITAPALVVARGVVQPAKQVVLQSQVTGRVLWLHEELVPGGYVQAGEQLVKLDGRDFQLSMASQASTLRRAQMELELEKGRQAVAEQEFKLFGDEIPTTDEGKALARREPQMESAKANVQSAQSNIAMSRLNLSRTVLEAPFNAMVVTENAELGQLVQPQTQLAQLVGTDVFWVQVSVPLADLSWIDIPGVNAQEGAVATVTQVMGARGVKREGRVLRLMGDVDPTGQQARVMVEVQDPLGLKAVGEGVERRDFPLLIGSFVDVEIQGRQLQDIVRVPRQAVRGADEVWVYVDGKLDIRKLDVAWRQPDAVLVRSGVKAGDLLVTSRLAAPVQDMELRIPEAKTAQLNEEKRP